MLLSGQRDERADGKDCVQITIVALARVASSGFSGMGLFSDVDVWSHGKPGKLHYLTNLT